MASSCFDVALWLNPPSSSSSSWPEYIADIDALTPFAAIEELMHRHHLSVVAYACTRKTDGSLIYRGYGVRRLCVEPVGVFEEREREDNDGQTLSGGSLSA